MFEFTTAAYRRNGINEKLTFGYSNALPFISENEIACLSPFVTIAHEMLHNRNGPLSDFTGWVDLPKKL